MHFVAAEEAASESRLQKIWIDWAVSSWNIADAAELLIKLLLHWDELKTNSIGAKAQA